MSLLMQLFGEKILQTSFADIKKKIRDLPPTRVERRGYLLKEYANIKGIELTKKDFDDVTPNP